MSDESRSRFALVRTALRIASWSARHPKVVLWSTVALAVLIVVSAVAPVGGLVAGLLSGLGALLEPLYDTPNGRLIALNLLLVGLGIWLLGTLRASLQTLRGDLLLRRHLHGVLALGAGQSTRAGEQFHRVVRSRAKAPQTYPAVRADASLKLARLHLEHGDAAAAQSVLLELDLEEVPAPLRPSWHHLRLRAEWQLGETLPVELVRDAEAVLGDGPPTVPLCALLAELRHGAGDLHGAVEARVRAMELAPGPRVRRDTEQLLVEELCRASELALAAAPPRLDEARDFATRARALREPGVDARPQHLLARIHETQGEARSAIQAWSEARTDQGLQAIAALLDAAEPGAIPAREFLELCPLDSAVVLAAGLYFDAEDVAAARRALRHARQAGPLPGWLEERARALHERLEHA